ncbi:MAG TPA: hypothetical protein VGG02_06225 [Chthoniobacterales bacterium]|jgi:hypothetical protein
MNDFSELEADLKKLRPAPVSQDLAQRIEAELQRANSVATAGVLPARRVRSSHWQSFGLGCAGLAALVVIAFTYFDQAPQNVATSEAKSSAARASGFQPVGLTQTVYSSHDEGLVFSPNDAGNPRRRLRYETRETMRWHNAATGASVRVSYPVEQVVLTPVSFQ